MKTKDQPPQRDANNMRESNPKSFNWLTAADTKTWLEERDACALVASVRKNGEATHGNLKRALAALSIMGHRKSSGLCSSRYSACYGNHPDYHNHYCQ